MELAKTQCYEFECFEDNYSLTISTQLGCLINTRNESITLASKKIVIAPRRDFAQKATSRGGTLVTRAYIKESTYS